MSSKMLVKVTAELDPTFFPFSMPLPVNESTQLHSSM